MLCLQKSRTINLKKLTQIINKTYLAAWIWDINQNDFLFISKKLINQFELLTNRKMTKKEAIRAFNHRAPHDVKYMINEFNKNQEFFYSYFVNYPDGESVWLDTTIISIRDEKDNADLAIGFVIERSKDDYQNNINLLNYQDQYTGLPNSSYGHQYLEKTINDHQQRKRTFTLYKIIIPTFRNIVTTFGHETANQVLLEVSNRLSEFISNKGFLYHSHLDGWYAIIPKDQDVQQTTKEMIKIIQEPLTIDQQRLHLSAKVGIGLFQRDGDNAKDLINHTTTALTADQALDHGKKGLAIHDYSIDLLRKSQLTANLFQSIQNKELYLEYQPKINIKSLKVTGAEALLRWEHPIWKNISPGEFIPLIQELGLSEDIAKFTIEEAVRQLKRWQEDGIEFPKVSVNLEPENFLIPDLSDFIKRTLNKYNVSPEQLELEVTEDTKLKYDESTIDAVEKIHSLGIGLALDDIGNGFGSVYDLVQFKFNTVKIDRKAIDDLENNEEQQIIIQTLLELCRRLNIKSVVEGVERKTQFDILRKLDCDEIQGFYFSPSVSAESMKHWFQMDYAIPSSNPSLGQIKQQKYFRLKLPNSLVAHMNISSIQNKEINLERDTEILIQAIGTDGMKFYSYLYLPTNHSIVYEFDINLLDEQYKLTGKVIWKNEVKRDIFEHEVEFKINESDREKLTSSLLRLSTLLRDQPLYTNNHIIEDDPVLYLKRIIFNKDTANN